MYVCYMLIKNTCLKVLLLKLKQYFLKYIKITVCYIVYIHIYHKIKDTMY